MLTTIESLHDTTDNVQCKLQILKSLLQKKLRHLQASDVLHADPNDISDDGIASTNFDGTVKDISENFVANLLEMNREQIEQHSWDIVYSPISMGGEGLLDPAHSSVGTLL